MIAATGPHIDVEALSPLLALTGGGLVVLLVGLLRPRVVREVLVPLLALASLAAALGLAIWQWDADEEIIAGALRVDTLALAFTAFVIVAAAITVLLSWRAVAPREAAHGEYYAMLLVSAAGMSVLVQAQNLVSLFIGFELLSVPLYVLCASEMRRSSSLEAGLKYLIIGSVGSATLLYGLALIYGATGRTDFAAIADALNSVGGPVSDPLFLTGLALSVVGLAFKVSVAPFHQWTPDAYEGAPTPVTAFMATATKVAALGVIIRFFDVALINAQPDWAPALAALATITIVVGNVGAIGQTSVKRLLAWSSVAQAGYMLAGIVVGTQHGIEAVAFYLAAYLVMNMAAFAVVVARARETGLGDAIEALEGIGQSKPLLAWPMTIAMLGLAGIPGTAGFIGKFFLIDGAVDGDYAWLGIVIVVGSAVSLVYYLKVVAAMWMRPAPRSVPVLAGGAVDDPPADAPAGPRAAGGEVTLVAVGCAAGPVVFGVLPGPLFDIARDAAAAMSHLF
ncbi:MAG: NADH-quinone oxidoreductase subunit N [Solirubrobacteraceae bacterium]|nr:NADH-quinone oxidoreductase subunit N [Solirubrobacteraceae bacterium]